MLQPLHKSNIIIYCMFIYILFIYPVIITNEVFFLIQEEEVIEVELQEEEVVEVELHEEEVVEVELQEELQLLRDLQLKGTSSGLGVDSRAGLAC